MAPSADIRDCSVTIVSYSHVRGNQFTQLGGPALNLARFLGPRCKRVVSVFQPLPISDDWAIHMEEYVDGNLRPVKRFPSFPHRIGGLRENWVSYFLLKARDVLGTLLLCLSDDDNSDYFIGVESHNALLGVLLRKLGRVKYVIYYIMDYGEVRFANRVLNSIFHKLDRAASTRVDCVWNLHPSMQETRIRLGLNPRKAAPAMTVPIGTYSLRIRPLKDEQVERQCLVYLGMLSENTGVPLLFDALPDIFGRFPQATAKIIGTGPLAQILRSKVALQGLESRVQFLGVLTDEQVEKILVRCGVGIAPYEERDETRVNLKKYTDPTKPKVYMACGLPVIITRVPPIAREIDENRAGIVISYDKESLIRAVSMMFDNDAFWKEARRNAVSLAARYDWDSVYAKTFAELSTVLTSKYSSP